MRQRKTLKDLKNLGKFVRQAGQKSPELDPVGER
jgi:hypothetical protein